jgi:hypothetical protein
MCPLADAHDVRLGGHVIGGRLAEDAPLRGASDNTTGWRT